MAKGEFDGLFSSGSESTSSKNEFGGLFTKRSKQQEEDEKRRKQLEAFKQVEKQKDAQPKKTLLGLVGDAGKAVFDAGKQVVDSSIEGFRTTGAVIDTATGQGQLASQLARSKQRWIEEDKAAGKLTPEQEKKDRKKISDLYAAQAKTNAQTAKQLNKPRAEVAADVAGAFLDVTGLKAGGQLIKEGIKSPLKTVIKNNAIEGAGFGLGYGANDAVKAKGDDVTTSDVTTGALTGAAFGTVASVALPIAGKAGGALLKKITGKGGKEITADTAAKTSQNEVVQVVNPTTGEKTFYRIPADKRDEIVNSIDNNRDGSAIAGKKVDGKVTHVTARSPEDMASRGFEDGGVYPQPEYLEAELKSVSNEISSLRKSRRNGEDMEYYVDPKDQARYDELSKKQEEIIYDRNAVKAGLAPKYAKQKPATSELKALEKKGKEQILDLKDMTRLKELRNLNSDVSQTGQVIPGDQVGQAVKNVATPPGQTPAVPGTAPSRYASKTLPESDFVGGETKKRLGAEYEQTTNAVRADKTLQSLDVEGVDNFSTRVDSKLDSKKIDDQDVFDAQGAAQALEARGDEASLQKAANIYDKLSTHLSKAGQTVQAASIMARQTPQGLAYYAQKQFKNAGVEFTPQLQKELQGYIKAVKDAPPKSEQMAIARDNVQYFIAQNIPSNKADQVINFWRSGLLTSPATTGGALAGNTAQALNRKLIENPGAVIADLIQSVFTGKRTQTLAKAGEGAKGAKVGGKNATSGQYWKTGYDPMTNADKQGKYDQPNRSINYGTSTLGKATGAYVNGVYKLMGAADQPFRYGAQREALSSMAKAEAINQGLKGKEAKAFVADFIENPPVEFLNRATKEAKFQTFQNETRLGNIVAGAKNSLRAQGHNKTAAMLDFFVPFNNVPAAVATRAVTNTPIGTAATLIKNIINVRKGENWDQREVAQAFGQGMSGLPILAAGVALGKAGLVTGGYPATKAERDQWEAEGKQPNSVKVGDRWYSLNYIQPFATLLAVGGKFAEAEQAGLSIEEGLNQSLAAGGNSLMSQSFLQGVQSFTDAVKNPTEYAGRYAANTAAGIVPNFIRAGVRAADPLQRESEGIEQGLMGAIPGLRGELPVKTNDDGEALTAKDTFLNQYINPLKPSQIKVDENTEFNNAAALPASRLKAVRQKQINKLLDDDRINAAQRKIDEYNKEVTEVLAPYVNANADRLTPEQMDRIDSLYLGEVFINKKGRPYISSRSDL